MVMKAEQQSMRAAGKEWFGVLGGPVAWLLQFIVNYALVRWECIGHSSMTIHLVSAGFLLVVIAAGIVSVNNFARTRGHPASEEKMASRHHFMAVLGIFTSSIFTLGIIMQAIASFIWNPCMR